MFTETQADEQKPFELNSPSFRKIRIFIESFFFPFSFSFFFNKLSLIYLKLIFNYLNIGINISFDQLFLTLFHRVFYEPLDEDYCFKYEISFRLWIKQSSLGLEIVKIFIVITIIRNSLNNYLHRSLLSRIIHCTV